LKPATLKRREISSLIKDCRWIKRKYYIIGFKEAKEKKFAFSAVKSIPTKVAKNRVKRILREIVRITLPSIHQGHYLIIGTQEILTVNFHELQSMLSKDLGAPFSN